MRVMGLNLPENFSRLLTTLDHKMGVDVLMDWIEKWVGCSALTAVGHRVVHGRPKYSKPQLITAEMIEVLRMFSSFNPEHMPEIRNWKRGGS